MQSFPLSRAEKIFRTMKARKIDNFKKWRKKHRVNYARIPTGNKEQLAYVLPEWIEKNKGYLVRFLRGLYEAEAYLSIHLPTSTYNFGFVNTNPYLLKIVENAFRRLEFHPEVRHNAIRIRRKAEVERLKNLLRFRQY